MVKVFDNDGGPVGTEGFDNPVFVSDEGLSRNSERKASLPAIQYKPSENRRMLKNVIVISISFMLLFTAFQSIAALQSSLNAEVRHFKHK